MVRSRATTARDVLRDQDHHRRRREESAGSQERRRVIVLRLALAALLMLSPLPLQKTDDVSVSGRVVDATSGRPIPGVVVTPAGSAVVVNPATPLPPRALTNADGEFTLRGLQNGMLHFTAAKSGYADATYKQRRPGGSGRGIPVARGQRLAGVEIRMWRHAAITGTIVDEKGETPPGGPRWGAPRAL